MKTTFSAQASPADRLPMVDAVVVGASAGGVEALLTVYSRLPAGYRLPIITVLHLPEGRPSQLATVFASRLAVPVKEADDKEDIVPGRMYFAAPAYHLSVERDLTLSLSQEDRVFHSRPSIDYLFDSAADAYGERLAGVLLTGANNDGARGLARIKQQGGLTVIQQPSEARSPIMPEAALKLHSPDYLLTLDEIAQLLVELERTAC